MSTDEPPRLRPDNHAPPHRRVTTKGPAWSLAEEEWLTTNYTSRSGLPIDELIIGLNTRFTALRPPRSLKAVKTKIGNLGLKRHPTRRAEIALQNRVAVAATVAAKWGDRVDDRPLCVPAWDAAPDAFRDVSAVVLLRERLLSPGLIIGRPFVEDRSLVGCASADLALA